MESVLDVEIMSVLWPVMKVQLIAASVTFFRLSKPEAMDDEVSKILRKWNLSNPAPKQDIENVRSNANNETFDTRTFTRPAKRRTFMNDELPSIESGVSELL